MMVAGKLPGKVKLLLFGNLISATGNGLILPFLFIYFHTVRGIPSGISGVLIGYGAIASLAASPLIGSLIDHWGPKPVLIASLIVSAGGYASLALVHGIVSALLSMTVLSVGQSSMWPSQSSIQAELTPEPLRERLFGSSFAIMNMGLGIGGLISSTVVDLADPHSFEILFILDGSSFLGYLLVISFVRGVGHRSDEEREVNAARSGGWKEVFADKTFVKFWLVCFGAILCGYSQLEVGFVSFSTLVAKVKPSSVAYAYAANTLLITAFQLWVSKKLTKVNRPRALALAALLWLFAWLTLSAAGVNKSHALLFIILCQMVFGVGEMVWSPVVPTIVNQLAPDHLRGRYNAASGNAWQFALILGPMIAGTMIGAGLHWLWIALLVTGLIVVIFFALRLKLPNRLNHSVQSDG